MPCLWPWASLSCLSPSLVLRVQVWVSSSELRSSVPFMTQGGSCWIPPLTPSTTFSPSAIRPHKSHFLALESSQFLTPGKWISPAQAFVWNGLENCITVSDFNLCSVCWRLHAAKTTQTKHYSCLQMIPIIFSLNKYCTWHSGIVRNENKFF